MSQGDLVSPALEHEFHSSAGVLVIVNDQNPARALPAIECFSSPTGLSRRRRSIGRRRGFHRGQLHRKGRTLVLTRAGDPNFATMSVYHGFGDGKAQTETAEAACNRALAL